MALPPTAKTTFQPQHTGSIARLDDVGNLIPCRIPATYLLGSASVNDVLVEGNTTQTAVAAGQRSVSIGTNTTTSTGAHYSVATGSGAAAQAFSGIAIGGSPTAGAIVKNTATAGVAIGARSEASAANAIAIGGGDSVVGATAFDSRSIAVGSTSYAVGSESVALGYDAQTGGDYALASGSGASASATEAVALGTQAFASAQAAVALGKNADATDVSSLSLGANSRALAVNSIAIGGDATTDEGAVASADNAIAIGNFAQTNGTGGSVGLGASTVADGVSCVAVGPSVVSTGDHALTLGTSDGVAPYTNSTDECVRIGTNIAGTQTDLFTATLASTRITRWPSFHVWASGNPSGTLPADALYPGSLCRNSAAGAIAWTTPTFDAAYWAQPSLAHVEPGDGYQVWVYAGIGATITFSAGVNCNGITGNAVVAANTGSTWLIFRDSPPTPAYSATLYRLN